MTEKHDGGPAFPHQKSDGTPYWGMSLRDWFAGQALAGLCAGMFEAPYDDVPKPDDLAWMAHKVADAMLEERKK